MQAEQVQAAVRDARLHGLAHHVRREQVRRQMHAFRRRHPVFRLDLHLFPQPAGGGAQAVERHMGLECPYGHRLDVLGVQALQHARERIDRDGAAFGNEQHVGKRILERADERSGSCFAQAIPQMGFKLVEEVGIVGEIAEIGAQPQPAAVRGGIDQKNADGKRRAAGDGGFEKNVLGRIGGQGLAAGGRRCDRYDGGRHQVPAVFILTCLSAESYDA